MPKMKDIVKDYISDKEERAQEGLKYLADKGIKLYNQNTKEELTLDNLPSDLGISRYSEGDKLESYLARFKEKGYVTSENLVENQQKTSNEINVSDDIVKEEIVEQKDTHTDQDISAIVEMWAALKNAGDNLINHLTEISHTEDMVQPINDTSHDMVDNSTLPTNTPEQSTEPSGQVPDTLREEL